MTTNPLQFSEPEAVDPQGAGRPAWRRPVITILDVEDGTIAQYGGNISELVNAYSDS